jgi:hypothetical protein
MPAQGDVSFIVISQAAYEVPSDQLAALWPNPQT